MEINHGFQQTICTKIWKIQAKDTSLDDSIIIQDAELQAGRRLLVPLMQSSLFQRKSQRPKLAMPQSIPHQIADLSWIRVTMTSCILARSLKFHISRIFESDQRVTENKRKHPHRSNVATTKNSIWLDNPHTAIFCEITNGIYQWFPLYAQPTDQIPQSTNITYSKNWVTKLNAHKLNRREKNAVFIIQFQNAKTCTALG